MKFTPVNLLKYSLIVANPTAEFFGPITLTSKKRTATVQNTNVKRIPAAFKKLFFVSFESLLINSIFKFLHYNFKKRITFRLFFKTQYYDL